VVIIAGTEYLLNQDFRMRRHIPLLLIVIAALLAVLGTGAPTAQEQPAATENEQSAPPDSVPPDLARARELLVLLETSLDSLLTIASRMEGMEDEARDVLRTRAQSFVETINDNQPRLLDLIPKLDAAGIPTKDIKARFKRFIGREFDIYERSVQFWAAELDDLREQRASAEPQIRGDIETGIEEARGRLDGLLQGKANTLEIADSLGLDASREWHRFEKSLTTRAENLVGRLQIAVKSRDKLQTKLSTAERAGATESELSADRTRLHYAERRVEGVASSLDETVDLLEDRGFEGAQYRQFIIETTGEISEKILDPKVLFGIVKNALVNAWNWLKDNALAFLIKLLIIIAFVLMFRIVFRLGWWVVRLLGLTRLSRLMRDLVDRMLNPFATIVGLIGGLWFLGVNPTHLLAGVGVAGVISTWTTSLCRVAFSER
jgi:small conductance mechanosensitive channel